MIIDDHQYVNTSIRFLFFLRVCIHKKQFETIVFESTKIVITSAFVISIRTFLHENDAKFFTDWLRCISEKCNYLLISRLYKWEMKSNRSLRYERFVFFLFLFLLASNEVLMHQDLEKKHMCAKISHRFDRKRVYSCR